MDNTEGVNLLPQKTETQETATDIETDENSKNVDNTRIITIYAEKTVENNKVFRHFSEKTNTYTEMGEGEILRQLRVYTNRVLETKAKILELETKGDITMIEKQKEILENRENMKTYWKIAHNKVTDGNSTASLGLAA
jgi:hypothetical protein